MQEAFHYLLPEYQVLSDVPTYFLEQEESVDHGHVKKVHENHFCTISGYV